MSFYEQAPIPPRPATQREVLDQLERLRHELEKQLRKAQDEATQKALQRALEAKEQHEQIVSKSTAKIIKETPKILNDLDKKQCERLTAITKQVYEDTSCVQKEMAKNVNRKMADLSTDIQDQFERVDRRLERQQTETETINRQMMVMADSINQLVSVIDNRFQQDEERIADIQGDLDQIHQRFQNEDEQAQEAVKTARALMTLVEGRAMLDRFAPENEAEDVRIRVNNLETCTLKGAALTAKVDEVITRIWETERHTAKAKAKHDALVDIAMAQVERVLAIVNENREVKQKVEGGEPMIVDNEFWSEGEYGRLEKKLNSLMAELEDRYNDKLTEKRVDDIVRESARIEGRILQICEESVAKAILSEARVEAVEIIINAMWKKGWMLKGLKEGKPENNYMGGKKDNDWRKGVFAVLENNLGEKITIIVDPVSDTQNRLIVHQEKENRTIQDLRNQMQAIQQLLHDNGYTVGQATSGETHVPVMGSATSLGKAHATDKVLETIQSHA